MIYKAGIEHAQLLTELGVETFIQSHRKSAPEHEIDSYVREKYNIDVIKNELANPGNIYHLIEHKNKMVGFSKMELNREHQFIEIQNASKMDQIYLLGSFHGLKLGTMLLQYNIEYSKSISQKAMWLIVWAGNHSAISFYRKFGFSVIRKARFHLTATHTNPCYIMLLNYASSKNF